MTMPVNAPPPPQATEPVDPGAMRPVNMDALKKELVVWDPEHVPPGSWFIAKNGSRVVQVMSYEETGQRDAAGNMIYNTVVRIYGTVIPTTEQELQEFEEQTDNQCPATTATGEYFQVWLLETPPIVKKLQEQDTQVAQAAPAPPPPPAPVTPEPLAEPTQAAAPVTPAPAPPQVTPTPVTPGAPPPPSQPATPTPAPTPVPEPQQNATNTQPEPEGATPAAGAAVTQTVSPSGVDAVMAPPPVVPAPPTPAEFAPAPPPAAPMQTVDKCPDHPRYRGKGKPKTKCPVCWQLHRQVAPEDWRKHYARVFGDDPGPANAQEPQTSEAPSPPTTEPAPSESATTTTSDPEPGTTTPPQPDAGLTGATEAVTPANTPSAPGFSILVATTTGRVVEVDVLAFMRALGQHLTYLHERIAKLEEGS